MYKYNSLFEFLSFLWPTKVAIIGGWFFAPHLRDELRDPGNSVGRSLIH